MSPQCHHHPHLLCPSPPGTSPAAVVWRTEKGLTPGQPVMAGPLPSPSHPRLPQPTQQHPPRLLSIRPYQHRQAQAPAELQLASEPLAANSISSAVAQAVDGRKGSPGAGPCQTALLVPLPEALLWQMALVLATWACPYPEEAQGRGLAGVVAGAMLNSARMLMLLLLSAATHGSRIRPQLLQLSTRHRSAFQLAFASWRCRLPGSCFMPPIHELLTFYYFILCILFGLLHCDCSPLIGSHHRLGSKPYGYISHMRTPVPSDRLLEGELGSGLRFCLLTGSRTTFLGI